MNPPGKTTLLRMLATAIEEWHRIEISQDGRVRIGMQEEPLPAQVLKRDDFAGIARILDAILGDPALQERVQAWMSSVAPAPAASKERPAPAVSATAPAALPDVDVPAAAAGDDDLVFDVDAEVDA